MQDLLKLPQLLAVVVTLGVLGWALGRWAMRLVQVALISLWRHRARHAAGLATAALVAILAGWGLVRLWRLGFDAFAPEPLPAWLHAVARDWLSLLVPLAATLSGLLAIGGMLGRWRRLVPQGAFEAEPLPLGPAPPRATGGRRIVILCDGTGNAPDRQEDGRPAATNVCKLSQALLNDQTQTVWYLPGVGTGVSSAAVGAQRAQSLLTIFGAGMVAQLASLWVRLVALYESAAGGGVAEAATRAYTEIGRQYRPGDRIYLIGFSRGAYTVRVVAGIIRRSGLLKAGNLVYAPDLVRLHLARRQSRQGVPIDPSLLWPDVDVEFLGVFDTVASLGAPLWGWWFTLRGLVSRAAYHTDPAPICRGVYHAMAMDERRAQFFPTPFDRPAPGSWTERFEQVWFRGAHADVGGGYADTGLSDIALDWMMQKAEDHGLSFHPGLRAALRPDPLARLHDEIARRPAWGWIGSWPRWHPVPGDAPAEGGVPGRLHPSVVERAEASWQLLHRPDLLRLAPGEAIEIWTEAHRNWDRTGLVIEPGAAYRITWLGGAWRDAGHAPIGPAGQVARGLDLRRPLFWRRRLPGVDWMALSATVAHRRPWPLEEYGLLRLMACLFWRDPEELRRQVAPAGASLRQPGDALVLRSEAPAGGLLYPFANDWWQTAANNSGSLKLEVRRLAAPDPACPVWRLRPDGTWEAPGPSDAPAADGVPV
jgi:uncharacterized protein (DUF2235 family)